ncbi:MAG: hypothetical protein IPP55_10080 [Anaerolineales bacterium]|nr:hypothetical protein [Anaerolineales bacterium]
MSRLAIRLTLAVLVSVVVIAGVFMSASSVLADRHKNSLGIYVLSGNLVNPLKPQTLTEQAAPQPQFENIPNEYRHCESEVGINPEE